MPHDLPLVPASHPDAELSFEQDHGALIRRSVLPGGVRVFTEHIPGMRSATVGAWVGVGSRDETPEQAGSTHFLEHLLFKGTPRRSAFDIAEAFDRVGGESNAMTAKEFTCYYARTIDVDLPMAIDVIGDMVTSARLDQEDFDSERGVILEELAMAEDDPGDIAHERFIEAVLSGHPLGRPIGGTPEIIRAVTRDAVEAHYRQHYVPEGLIVTAAGGLDHDLVCQLVQEALTRGGWGLSQDRAPLARRDTNAQVQATVVPEVSISRDLEQSHVVLGSRGFKATDDRRQNLAVFNAILGGGMSSRLFQEIREKRGLTYAVYSFGMPSAETGVFGMYAACNPARATEVTALMEAEAHRMSEGVTPAELERAKGQIAGAMVLRLEDSYARMSRLGKAELVMGELWSIGEALEQVHAVTADDVASLGADLAAREHSLVRVGPGADT
ncbi:MAG: pitrilysin family protein [Demequina sp.]